MGETEQQGDSSPEFWFREVLFWLAVIASGVLLGLWLGATWALTYLISFAVAHVAVRSWGWRQQAPDPHDEQPR